MVHPETRWLLSVGFLLVAIPYFAVLYVAAHFIVKRW